MAERLQGIADPGQVIICAETRRLVGEAFCLTELESPQALRSGLIRLAPGVAIAAPLQAAPFAYQDGAKCYAEVLRKAGLPEI